MSEEERIEFPSQFSHSVKIEQSAKGARVTVHVLGKNQQEVIDQAVRMYPSVRKRLEEEGHILSPIEIKDPTATSAVT